MASLINEQKLDTLLNEIALNDKSKEGFKIIIANILPVYIETLLSNSLTEEDIVEIVDGSNDDLSKGQELIYDLYIKKVGKSIDEEIDLYIYDIIRAMKNSLYMVQSLVEKVKDLEPNKALDELEEYINVYGEVQANKLNNKN